MTENSTTAGTIIIPARDAIKVIRRLAVVGAGLAGLTVAHKLAAAGVEVTLFEKGRGPGGRMASTRLESTSLRASRMQACWTVMAHFPEGAGADFEAVMPNQSLLNWAANDSSKPGRQGSGEWWVLHGDPDWSDDHACAGPQQVAAQLVQELRRVGEITAVPAEVQVHRWLYARAKASTGTGHLWFPDSGIAIIGDWLDGGRVEGAFNSADGLASRLISEGRVPRGG